MSMPELNFELPSPELGLAYAAIMTMAAIPIYIGSFLSLKQKKGVSNYWYYYIAKIAILIEFNG
jgi:hypothetical protein